MAKKTYDNPFASMFADMPVDMSMFNDAFKNTAAIGEKFSRVALNAAEKNAEISNKWTKDTLAKLAVVSKVQEDPADYSKVLTDFASGSVEAASEHVAAYAEVAKQVQMDTVELLMATGKEVQAEASAVVKKATVDATDAVKKATAKAA
ncbi:MAG: phasin, PhaP [Rhodobacteraceae bacterium]|nr:phasin, PhaP [Paracoccaceae bacterium]MCB1366988.1 phasin, PhaP [Paracoccaceae bacterium]